VKKLSSQELLNEVVIDDVLEEVLLEDVEVELLDDEKLLLNEDALVVALVSGTSPGPGIICRIFEVVALKTVGAIEI
jgi:hypothetical protein